MSNPTEDELKEQAKAILKAYFGYDAFRPGQAELIEAVLSGRDCLGVMPTGAGKSLCYQVPALALAYDDVVDIFGGKAAGADTPGGEAACADVAGGQAARADASGVEEACADVAGGQAVRARASLVNNARLAVAGERRQGADMMQFRPARATALVVSPLVSLMSDQVMALRAVGIPAAYLNSRLTPAQQEEVLGRAAAGAYALMYVAPERLADPRFLEAVCAGRIPLSLVAVDEAHCVSQWGQDFRPSYLGISEFIRSLPTRPVVAAFTATATSKVAADIVRLLEQRDPLQITTGFDRPNLHFSVEQLSDKKKLARLVAHAMENPNNSGIVYCSTRREVEHVHKALLTAGVRATRYHAGLAHGEREANQRAFVDDDAPVMVATNAFGMGIDKSNVRYVVHFNMPGSLEAYYQEAGRAGRDGEQAECLLMWNDSDIATCRFFIEQESGNEALTFEEQQIVRASQRRRLAAMANYCMTCDCLRATILRYFGESVGYISGPLHKASVAPCSAGGEALPAQLAGDESRMANLRERGLNEPIGSEAEFGEGLDQSVKVQQFNCGNCSNCTGDIDAVDVTKTARSVMRCVHELRGRYGKGIVTDVLCGSKSAKMKEYGLTSKKTYNIVDDSAATVKEIIELLTAGEYLEISEGRYPLVGLGPRARQAATDEFRLYMKRHRAPVLRGSSRENGGRSGRGRVASTASLASATTAALTTDEQKALFERLRALRKRLADEEGMPPYIVFSDATLRAMCANPPTNEQELLAIPGVGPAKLARYGDAFLEEIGK